MIERSAEFWVSLLKEQVLAKDLPDETVLSLLNHLADLDVFHRSSEGMMWQLQTESAESDLSRTLDEKIRSLSEGSEGFVLAYFLPDYQPEPAPPSTEPVEKSASPFRSRKKINPSRTSNLSNLQIVNKYGRQMGSFLEMEKEFIERLQGDHTTRQDARRLFNFSLSRLQEKVPGREWDQLSRRRHK